MPSRDFNETRTIYTNSDNIETFIGNKTDQIFEKLFESLLGSRRIRRKMRGSEFIYDSIDL